MTAAVRAQSASATKLPWLSFAFLSTVFFVVQHDWFYSLNDIASFQPTVDDIATAAAEGNPLRRVAMIALGVFAVISLYRTRRRPISVNGWLGALILFFLTWMLLSAAWSQDVALTSRRLVVLVMMGLGSIAVARSFEPRQLVLWVLITTAIYAAVGLIAEVSLGTFHPFDGTYRFAGTIHPNHQGMNCALMLFAAIFLSRAGTRITNLAYMMAIVALGLLLMTKSRASLGFAVTSLLVFWAVTGSALRKLAVAVSGVIVGCIAIGLRDLVTPIVGQAINLGRGDTSIGTLGGRLPLWGQVLSYISQRPVQGYGYDCFWTFRHIADVATQVRFTPAHSHNAYLDIVLGLGIVGGVCYVLIAGFGVTRALHSPRLASEPSMGFLSVTLMFAVFEGFLEPTVILPGNALFVSFVVMVSLASLAFAPAERSGRRRTITALAGVRGAPRRASKQWRVRKLRFDRPQRGA